MEQVEHRLRRVVAALNAAGLRYAVIGGNAVAAWIATRDTGATRTTKDVDVMIDRTDLDAVTAVLTGIGLQREDLRSITLFVDPSEPNRKTGVHIIWAGERVRPSYAHTAPTLDEAVRFHDGMATLGLPALVRMKLTSFRDLDRVHIADMLAVGLVDTNVKESLPNDLRARLAEIERTRDTAEDDF